MRDAERLDDFYDRMKKIHQEKLPDWRFGQLMGNFLGWLVQQKGDYFYVEDAQMLKYFEEYVDSLFNNCSFNTKYIKSSAVS